MIFSNWIYTGDQVNLTYRYDADELVLSSYTESGEWDIVETLVSREDTVYDYGVPYPQDTFKIRIRRYGKSMFAQGL